MAAAAGSSTDTASKEDVLEALKQVTDPDLGTDIVASGFVSDVVVDAEAGSVSFRLEVGLYEEPAREQVSKLSWVKSVDVQVASGEPGPAPAPPRPMPRIPTSLDKVRSIIAVSSCKGGVGKSTVAVNLAFELQKSGAKVGIMDCDVYGPSLPVMVHFNEAPQMEMYADDEGQKHIKPVVHPESGMKLVSFGYAGKAAVMRGSMVTGLISQLMTQTDWGELDYLVLDLPPGTGDIHLTLAQVCKITAAVIVTTPQRLSVIDVERGISMFSQLAVPSIAVVQNMGYVETPDGKRMYPFGSADAGKEIAETFGIDHVFELPMDPEISSAGDTGNPFVVHRRDDAATGVMGEIADAVKSEVEDILKGTQRPVVRYDSSNDQIIVQLPDGEVFGVEAETLRLRDKGAGGPIPLASGVYPAELQDMGNYAIVIRWSDDHVQVVPHKQLIEGDEKGPMPRMEVASA